MFLFWECLTADFLFGGLAGRLPSIPRTIQGPCWIFLFSFNIGLNAFGNLWTSFISIVVNGYCDEKSTNILSKIVHVQSYKWKMLYLPMNIVLIISCINSNNKWALLYNFQHVFLYSLRSTLHITGSVGVLTFE